jgi:hypothetical protein
MTVKDFCLRFAWFPAGLSRLARLASAALVGVLVAACGGGGGDGPATPPTAPRLEIRTDAPQTVRGLITLEFVFSDDVSIPTGELKFSLSGANVVPGSAKLVNSRRYTVDLQPWANRQGLIDLGVPPGAFKDRTGAVANTIAYEFIRPYDTLAPYAVMKFLGPIDPLGRITGAGAFRMQFNSVLDAPLAAQSLVASSGSISGFQKTSAAGELDTYTFNYTPPPATRGGLTFELPKGSVSSKGIGNVFDWWPFALATP